MSEYKDKCGNPVPIKVNRVFDSCSDRDCISGVQVALADEVPENATIVKSKCATISDVCISVDPIPFNKGFYSVDITFTFNVELAFYETTCGAPTIIEGTATFSKNCILYGSETNSRTFYSDGTVTGTAGECCSVVNPPTALVQVVSPLVLEAKIVTSSCNRKCCVADSDSVSRGVELTMGIFYVVELVRPVTIMVPTYPYTIPQKECCCETDTPCEVFDKIKFPVEEFTPGKYEKPSHESYGGSSSCGCGLSTLSINPPPLEDDGDDYKAEEENN